MSGLVEQLQSDALNPSIPVSNLLRKVKVAAVKLGLPDAVTWVDAELNGYDENPPAYRSVSGHTVGWNPYHGWQPIYFEHAETADVISRIVLREPISSYEAILAQSSEQGTLILELNAETVSLLNKTFEFCVPRVANRFSRGAIVAAVEHVRNMVLEWSLELQKAGIKGDGLSFTSEERTMATSSHISIGTFHGSFNAGDASGQNARINQGAVDNSENEASETSVFDQIEAAIKSQLSEGSDQLAMSSAVSEMRDAKGTGNFLAAYQGFVQSSANHMSIVAPFFPALMSYLGT